MNNLVSVVCIGVVVGFLTSRIVRALAHRWDFVDRPDGHHKYHQRDVALGGGLAVFISVVITLIAAFLISPQTEWLSQSYMDGLLLASGWIVALGLFDDRYGMPGRYKLLGQLLAALIMISEGMVIEAFTAFGFKVTLGGFAIPFTVLWLVGAINSLNLLDGIDGLATTIGIVLCAAIAVLATILGHTAVAMISTAFAASLLGFLRYNFPPATMFLGDAGSMLIGLIVGTLAITASMKGPATVALAAPLAIWALPIFDSVTAIIRRKLAGRSIYATDRGHLHHRLLSLFGSNKHVLGVVAACCAITCAGALASMLMQNDLVALGSIVVVVLILVLTRAFGYVEVLMLASRAKSFGASLLRSSRDPKTQYFRFRIQGSRDWDLLWQSISELAEKLQLIEVRLDINVAAIQEGYHASLRRPTDLERTELWRIEIPLFVGSQVIGRLVAAGARNGAVSSCEAIREMVEMLEPLEAELVSFAGEEQAAAATAKPVSAFAEASAEDTEVPIASAIAPIDS